MIPTVNDIELFSFIIWTTEIFFMYTLDVPKLIKVYLYVVQDKLLSLKEVLEQIFLGMGNIS